MLDIKNITSSKERMEFLIQSSYSEFSNLFNLEGHLETYKREADKVSKQIDFLDNVLRVEYHDTKKQLQTAKETLAQIENFKEVVHQTDKMFEKILRLSEVNRDINVAIEQMNNVIAFKNEIGNLSSMKHCLRRVHLHVIEKAKARVHLFKKIHYLLDSPMKARIYFENENSRQDYTFEITDLHQLPSSSSVVEYREWVEILTKFYSREIDKIVLRARDQFRELLHFIAKRMSPVNEITKNFTLGEFIKARSDIYNMHINKLVGEKNFYYHYFRFSSGYMRFEKEVIANIEKIYDAVQLRARSLSSQGFNMSNFFNMNLEDFIYQKRVLREVTSIDESNKVNWGNFLVKKNPALRPILNKLISQEVRTSVEAKELSQNVFIRTPGNGYHSELFVFVLKGETIEPIKRSLSEDFRHLREIDKRINILRLNIDQTTSVDVEIEVTTFHGVANSFAKAS